MRRTADASIITGLTRALREKSGVCVKKVGSSNATVKSHTGESISAMMASKPFTNIQSGDRTLNVRIEMLASIVNTYTPTRPTQLSAQLYTTPAWGERYTRGYTSGSMGIVLTQPQRPPSLAWLPPHPLTHTPPLASSLEPKFPSQLVVFSPEGVHFPLPLQP